MIEKGDEVSQRHGKIAIHSQSRRHLTVTVTCQQILVELINRDHQSQDVYKFIVCLNEVMMMCLERKF